MIEKIVSVAIGMELLCLSKVTELIFTYKHDFVVCLFDILMKCYEKFYDQFHKVVKKGFAFANLKIPAFSFE